MRKVNSIEQLTVVETELLCLELGIDLDYDYQWRYNRWKERTKSEYHLVNYITIYKQIIGYADFYPCRP